MTDHPITPPPELVQQWRSEPEYSDGHHKITMVTMSQDRLMEICEKSALHGADQELEAIQKEIITQAWFADPGHRLAQLRAARRPKPPSLKEQALEVLGNVQKGWGLAEVDLDTIRLALEQLND
jgi:hypothetical protein